MFSKGANHDPFIVIEVAFPRFITGATELIDSAAIGVQLLSNTSDLSPEILTFPLPSRPMRISRNITIVMIPIFPFRESEDINNEIRNTQLCYSLFLLSQKRILNPNLYSADSQATIRADFAIWSTCAICCAGIKFSFDIFAICTFYPQTSIVTV